MLQNNTHIFFTAFLTVFTCFHSLTTVNVYCEGEALRNTMISHEWNHNELRPTSQIFTQTERQSSCSASVLSDLFSPFVVCCFKKKVFCAHGARASTTEGKTTSPGIWREGNRNAWFHSSCVFAAASPSYFFSPPPPWFTAGNRLRQGA